MNTRKMCQQSFQKVFNFWFTEMKSDLERLIAAAIKRQEIEFWKRTEIKNGANSKTFVKVQNKNIF